MVKMENFVMHILPQKMQKRLLVGVDRKAFGACL
jgi:hypothetical protein